MVYLIICVFRVMYWAVHGALERAQMDGENRTEIFPLTDRYNDSFSIDGIALDETNNRLYFASIFESIMYLDLDTIDENGEIQVLLAEPLLLLTPATIAVDDQYLYWNILFYNSVVRINKTSFDGGQSLEVVAQGAYLPNGLAIKKGIPTRDSMYSLRRQ